MLEVKPPEVDVTETEPLPAPLQKYSLDGRTVDSCSNFRGVPTYPPHLPPSVKFTSTCGAYRFFAIQAIFGRCTGIVQLVSDRLFVYISSCCCCCLFYINHTRLRSRGQTVLICRYVAGDLLTRAPVGEDSHLIV